MALILGCYLPSNICVINIYPLCQNLNLYFSVSNKKNKNLRTKIESYENK